MGIHVGWIVIASLTVFFPLALVFINWTGRDAG